MTGGAPLEAWVFKIAHNIVVDHLRKKSRRPDSDPIDEAFSLAGPQDPQKEVEKRQEAEFLHRALKQLSDAHQQVLALRFGAEMTSEEAAHVLGQKPGAVREMQSAAIKKLRQVLGAIAGAQA
jgi:RNA polymerase sigma-70 factor (ECF subfamily)